VVERTWVVDVDGVAVGAARLERHGDAVEAGIWLSRDARGRGTGKQVTAEPGRCSAESARTWRRTATTSPRNYR
jgi:hypothetical protein